MTEKEKELVEKTVTRTNVWPERTKKLINKLRKWQQYEVLEEEYCVDAKILWGR